MTSHPITPRPPLATPRSGGIRTKIDTKPADQLSITPRTKAEVLQRPEPTTLAATARAAMDSTCGPFRGHVNPFRRSFAKSEETYNPSSIRLELPRTRLKSPAAGSDAGTTQGSGVSAVSCRTPRFAAHKLELDCEHRLRETSSPGMRKLAAALPTFAHVQSGGFSRARFVPNDWIAKGRLFDADMLGPQVTYAEIKDFDARREKQISNPARSEN